MFCGPAATSSYGRCKELRRRYPGCACVLLRAAQHRCTACTSRARCMRTNGFMHTLIITHLSTCMRARKGARVCYGYELDLACGCARLHQQARGQGCHTERHRPRLPHATASDVARKDVLVRGIRRWAMRAQHRKKALACICGLGACRRKLPAVSRFHWTSRAQWDQFLEMNCGTREPHQQRASSRHGRDLKSLGW